MSAAKRFSFYTLPRLTTFRVRSGMMIGASVLFEKFGYDVISLQRLNQNIQIRTLHSWTGRYPDLELLEDQSVSSDPKIDENCRLVLGVDKDLWEAAEEIACWLHQVGLGHKKVGFVFDDSTEEIFLDIPELLAFRIVLTAWK